MADLIAARLANKELRYSDAESLMQKDSQANPEAVLVWVELGLAQLGLKKYHEAELSFQKALGIDPDTQKAMHREDFYAEEGRTHSSRNTADHVVATTSKLTPDVKGVCYAALGGDLCPRWEDCRGSSRIRIRGEEQSKSGCSLPRKRDSHLFPGWKLRRSIGCRREGDCGRSEPRNALLL